jgi:hypothetical protein
MGRHFARCYPLGQQQDGGTAFAQLRLKVMITMPEQFLLLLFGQIES